MKRILKFFLGALLLCVGIFLLRKWADSPSSGGVSSSFLVLPREIERVESYPTHASIFQPEQFYRSVESIEVEQKRRVKGVIIPHHLLAGKLIADSFSRIKPFSPKTVILVSPNHYEEGDFEVISSRYGWDTPFGKVLVNQKLISALEDKGFLKVDERVLAKEHAISSTTPFIKYFLPDADVVPLIISKKMDFQEANRLAVVLADYLRQEDVILIGSIDFSHYLTSQLAEFKDEETRMAIEKRDYGKIFAFSNDNLDSPAALSVVLMTMDLRGKNNMTFINHTNSAEILKDNVNSITSYFELIFED